VACFRVHSRKVDCFVRHCVLFSTVAVFFQFLEVNGLYFMQVTLQDYCNVVLNYVEVELNKKLWACQA